jgi:hypothetical protein
LRDLMGNSRGDLHLRIVRASVAIWVDGTCKRLPLKGKMTASDCLRFINSCIGCLFLCVCKSVSCALGRRSQWDDV